MDVATCTRRLLAGNPEAVIGSLDERCNIATTTAQCHQQHGITSEVFRVTPIKLDSCEERKDGRER